MKAIYNKLINLIKRGFVISPQTDNKTINLSKIGYLGREEFVEVISPYGLYANLPENTQVIIFNVNASENNMAAIGYSQADRFKNLEFGEVVVGNPKSLANIKFDKDGKIIITAKGDIDIIADGGLNLSLGGNIVSNTDINLSISGDFNIDANKINLGVGGNEIARKGDSVIVNVGGTDYAGIITTGGTNTSI